MLTKRWDKSKMPSRHVTVGQAERRIAAIIMRWG